jgi:hypothetical protein
LQIPAVKGMEMPEFSEHPDWDVEFCFSEISFSGWMDSAIASAFRAIREYIIEKDDVETADKYLPGFLIENLIAGAAQDAMEDAKEGDNEPKPMYSEGKMTEDELNQRIAEVEVREAAIALREHQTQKRTEFSEWIEPLIAEGKVLPAEKAQLVATMVALSGDAKVEFGEGDDAQSLSLVEAFKKSLEARAKIIEYSEQGKAGEPIQSSGDRVDTNLAMKARAMVEKSREENLEISFTEAVQKLTGGRR